MADTLKLEIVTPTAVAYAADVQMVTLSGADGQIGVYPQHVPLLLRIVPGEIIVRRDGAEEFLAVGGGLAAIGGDRVAVITYMAVAVKDIDEAKAEEALGMPITYLIPEDAKTINRSNNQGTPAVLSAPSAKVSRSLVQLAQSVNGRAKS